MTPYDYRSQLRRVSAVLETCDCSQELVGFVRELAASQIWSDAFLLDDLNAERDLMSLTTIAESMKKRAHGAGGNVISETLAGGAVLNLKCVEGEWHLQIRREGTLPTKQLALDRWEREVSTFGRFFGVPAEVVPAPQANGRSYAVVLVWREIAEDVGMVQREHG